MREDKVKVEMALAISEARSACKGEPDILERVRKAMTVCHDHWMCTLEVDQFNSALAAAMLESMDEKERDRIARSGRAFNSVNNAFAAMVSGVPVDLEAVAKQAELGDDIIQVHKLWNETK
jgi:hypothetical protein